MRLFKFFLLVFFCLHVISFIIPAMFIGGAGFSIYLIYQASKYGGVKHHYKGWWMQRRAQYIAESMDEPCIEVVIIDYQPVVIGGSHNREAIDRICIALRHRFGSVVELVKPIIGFPNKQLESKVMNKLMRTFGVRSRNYKVRAIKGYVWVLGIAKNEKEKRKVIEKARRVKGVHILIDYIVINHERDGHIEWTNDRH